MSSRNHRRTNRHNTNPRLSRRLEEVKRMIQKFTTYHKESVRVHALAEPGPAKEAFAEDIAHWEGELQTARCEHDDILEEIRGF